MMGVLCLYACFSKLIIFVLYIIRGCELGREIHSTEKAIMQSGLWCGLYNRISLRSFFCILPKKLSASLAFEICFILININDQVESNTLL